MSLRIEALTGAETAKSLTDLARLRIAVFRAFPYLYDGDMAYEAAYLERFASSRNALIVGAWDGDRLVGAATAAPMEDHAEEFAAPFLEQGHRLEDFLYCGESVLLPEYRGHGVGHSFFDQREAHGRALGRRISTFCAVIRPQDHPMRPEDYRPLDAFWTKRGYRKGDGLVAGFSWKDVGQPEETEKKMQFWLHDL